MVFCCSKEKRNETVWRVGGGEVKDKGVYIMHGKMEQSNKNMGEIVKRERCR